MLHRKALQMRHKAGENGVGPRFVKLFIFAIFVLILGALAIQLHIIKLPPQNLNERPGWLTSFKLKSFDLDPEACSVALNDVGRDGTLLPDVNISNSCHKIGTVMLTKLSTARVREEQTRCSIAARLYMWDRYIVQPAARKFYGQSVKEVLHYGSYNCRTIRGSHAMSEHATANAIDISGVKLADGTIISIRNSWNVDGPDSDFLHALRNGMCDYFNLTLSPDYNTDHRDHFHVDMGWVRRCR